MSPVIRAAALGDLPAILRLQRDNLERALGTEEAREQGFVTVVHDEETLRQMHALAPSVVAEEEGALVGYALTMTIEAQSFVPALQPMFEQLATFGLTNFYVMGQICVARSHRGRGVFDALYAGHRALYGSHFDALVTEISARNTRSRRAHERAGFEVIHRYRGETDEWLVVVLRLAK
jgi:L-amino acid N-acyltransferase YncA